MGLAKARAIQLSAVCVVCVLCTAAVKVAMATGDDGPGAAFAYDADRVRRTTCCDLVGRHWPLLRRWHRDCAGGSATLAGKLGRFQASLAAAAELSGGTKVCDEKKRSLGAGFLGAFVEQRLCVGLPSTHTELVRSVYGVFVAENPLAEDDLTTLISEACAGVQREGVEAWRRSLQLQAVREAQRAICVHECLMTHSPFDGEAYDL
ncbi:putative phosphomannomutase-like protein [Trypanosoma grayi]|uniref:putative phosphomannomutase-like protein n=1 Tax=Trypanosoma grayi TaxID=71804 RepID=UPI0004F3F51B|nr:putative phosphomannomutase-like protein [Trypanosoma grayi]KEG15351.1 putative phosphomannomutase-like protein [Trypanosoma grayi]